jgi:hypothetical protein
LTKLALFTSLPLFSFVILPHTSSSSSLDNIYCHICYAIVNNLHLRIWVEGENGNDDEDDGYDKLLWWNDELAAEFAAAEKNNKKRKKCPLP